MDKYNKLFKNIGILTIGQFGSKLLVFLLVPLYTSVLTTEEYGAYDLIHSTVSLLIPLLTSNISVSVQRFLMDKDADKNSINSIGTHYILFGIMCSAVLLLLNSVIGVSTVFQQYGIWIFLLFASLSINSLTVEIAVGNDKIGILAISGILSTIVQLLLNIILLIVIKWGVIGYFIANIAGPLMQSVFISIKLDIFKGLRKNDNQNLKSEMLSYSRPQIANNIAWWINNSSDRYIVTWLCGLTINGIYSVAYKIPTILSVVQNIFGQAWGISAVKNFDKKDSDDFFSRTYEIYNFIMVLACSLIILTSKILAKVMYARDFFDAWIYVPFLSMASVFGAMAGYLGGIFSAEKEAKIFAQSTVVGAICNTILNVMLVYLIGAIGAAIATMISYLIVWLFRYIHAKKYITIRIEINKHIVMYLILLLQSIAMMYIKNNSILYTIEAVALLFIVMFNRDKINSITKMMQKIIENR